MMQSKYNCTYMAKCLAISPGHHSHIGLMVITFQKHGLYYVGLLHRGYEVFCFFLRDLMADHRRHMVPLVVA